MAGDPKETQQVDEFARRIHDATTDSKIEDARFSEILRKFVAEKGDDICPFFVDAQKKLDAAKGRAQISDAISDIWMDVMKKATSDPVRASVNIMESVIRNSQFKGQLSPEALKDIAAAAESEGLIIKTFDNDGVADDGIKEDLILLYEKSDNEFKTPLATHQVELSKNLRNR